MISKVALALALSIALPTSAHATISASSTNGASISISKNKFSKNSLVTVTGKDFDETVGIYLAYCVVPKKGSLPTPCGGGVNKTGSGDASFWISSNPPPYAVGLTEEFLPGGRFTQKVKISKKIGKFDCTKVKCAITVRADHLRSNDRSSDLFIPITVK